MEFRADIRILVVDDFPSMRTLFRKMLLNLGLTNVIDAENGEQAFEFISGSPVDLVISDWNMPKISGIDLLRQMRSKDSLKLLPFLMVTG